MGEDARNRLAANAVDERWAEDLTPELPADGGATDERAVVRARDDLEHQFCRQRPGFRRRARVFSAAFRPWSHGVAVRAMSDRRVSVIYFYAKEKRKEKVKKKEKKRERET
jgi:hypothetical protein